MATMTNPIELTETRNHFVVIHPLDDVREEKVDISALGPMPMTTSVRISLMSLRGYLVLMILMVFYHVIQLARH